MKVDTVTSHKFTDIVYICSVLNIAACGLMGFYRFYCNLLLFQRSFITDTMLMHNIKFRISDSGLYMPCSMQKKELKASGPLCILYFEMKLLL